MTHQDILLQIIDAHGDQSLWKNLDAIEADISTWGFLFTIKRRPVLNHVKVTAKTLTTHLIFQDFPSPGLTGELIGNDEVRFLDNNGKIVAQRLQPRSAFKGLRHFMYWDALDFINFGGYATWNYLVTPFLFLREGFQIAVLESGPGTPQAWVKLSVTFPDDVPVHCRKQIFYFDDNRHLRRIDYTAEVVGHWAHAAHICNNYRDFDGFKAPTTRKFYHSYGAAAPCRVRPWWA